VDGVAMLIRGTAGTMLHNKGTVNISVWIS